VILGRGDNGVERFGKGPCGNGCHCRYFRFTSF
jgi:hypothetical protein